MSRSGVHARFARGVNSPWRQTESGAGRIRIGGDGLRLGNDAASARGYTNAQIDDYQGLARRDFRWQPPLRFTARARFSHNSGTLTGTAGFGFWNDPFRKSGLRPPALPQALWFIYAGPDADMRLAPEQPGWGWKASLLDACTPRFLVWAPLLALTAPLMRIPPLTGWLWRAVQQAAGIADLQLPVAMRDWHIYTIDWQCERVRFSVDGRLLEEISHAPAGPLGLVLWLDNQYLQIAPWGHFRWGMVAKEATQWLEIDWLAVESASA